MSSLGGLTGGLAGLSSQLGIGSVAEPTESPAFYGELLQSRELLTRLLLTRFRDPRKSGMTDSARLVDIMKLRSDDPRRRIELGVKQLQKSLVTESDVRTNLVKLTVSERYPTLAASEANATLALVNQFNLEQRTSRARGKRVYLEGRVAAAQGGSARSAGTLSRLPEQQPDVAVRRRRSSSEEETLRRNEDMASQLYLSLETQYEAARLDEFNDAALITVVDSAVPPVKPYWPRYSLLIPGALLFGLFLGVMVAGIAAVYSDWSRRDPAAAQQLASALSRRRRISKPSVARRA